MDRSKARILVVEDDPTIRRSLVVALHRAGYEVASQSHGSGIDQVAERVGPDLALLDVRLPVGPNGFEIARILRGRGRIPILFLTAADSLRDRLEGFDVGGDDYLTKPFELDELLARVKALLRRAGHRCSGPIRVGGLVLDEEAHVVVWEGTKLNLTHIEYELLSTMARHPGQVLSKDQLLEQVWGYDAYNPNRVEVHMSSVRRKLDAVGAHIVHTVRGTGYVFRA